MHLYSGTSNERLAYPIRFFTTIGHSTQVDLKNDVKDIFIPCSKVAKQILQKQFFVKSLTTNSAYRSIEP